MSIRRPQSVKSETTGETRNGLEKTFESLRHVMRDEVFVISKLNINAMPIE